MGLRRYSQNQLDWEVSEALAYLYGATNMLLVVGPLCEPIACLFLSALLVSVFVFFGVRITMRKQVGPFVKMLPSTVVPTLKWSAALGALALALALVGFDRLHPENMWGEIIETLSYLVVMSLVMLISIPLAFNARTQEVMPTASLERDEKRLFKLYFLVVLRIMLHKRSLTDLFCFVLLFLSVHLTTFAWRFGFHPAKFE